MNRKLFAAVEAHPNLEEYVEFDSESKNAIKKCDLTPNIKEVIIDQSQSSIVKLYLLS